MKNKGITLVALVVSIIIMLILAGVTLNIALGENGLFKMTQEAVKKYDEKAKEEDNTLKDIEEQLGGYVSDRSMLKVGDEVNYTPKTEKSTYILDGNKSGYGEYSSDNSPYKLSTSTNQTINQEEYTWKIMDINSKTGEVKIIGVPTLTNKNVYFQGALGYTNGVYLLDDICKTLYSNSDLGVTARSIDIEDIESKMNNKGKEARDTYISNNQVTKVFTGSNAYYPTIYKFQQDSNVNGKENTNGISESDDGTKTDLGIPLSHEAKGEGYEKAETGITVKGTYYSVEQNSGYYYDYDFYNLIFKTPSELNVYYWLASRYSSANSPDSYAYFGLFRVSSNIGGYRMFTSDGNCNANGYRVCPVVSLESDIKITREGNEGAWNLSK